MAKKLRVCGAQQDVTDSVPANIAQIRASIDCASGEHADILLTPEGSLSGYRADFDRGEVRKALEEVTAYAREKRVGLALGTCFEEDDGRCHNQVRFYSAEGAYLGFQSKTLTCGSLEDPPKGEINAYAVAPLQIFSFKGVAVGALVCNDMWANPGCTPQDDPHLLWKLSGMGARIVFHAVNGGRCEGDWADVTWRYHESNLRMRARAAGVWVVTVDNSYPSDSGTAAPSGVVGPDGDWVCRVERKGEQRFVHTISLR
jgi:predicted amidohydrolase